MNGNYRAAEDETTRMTCHAGQIPKPDEMPSMYDVRFGSRDPPFASFH